MVLGESKNIFPISSCVALFNRVNRCFLEVDGTNDHECISSESEFESYVAGALCMLSRHRERFAWADGSLFRSGIVLMKKEFENGLFLVWIALKLCVLPLVLLSGLHSISIKRATSPLLIALWSMQSLAVVRRSCKLSQPKLSISWVEVSSHSLL